MKSALESGVPVNALLLADEKDDNEMTLLKIAAEVFFYFLFYKYCWSNIFAEQPLRFGQVFNREWSRRKPLRQLFPATSFLCFFGKFVNLKISFLMLNAHAQYDFLEQF